MTKPPTLTQRVEVLEKGHASHDVAIQNSRQNMANEAQKLRHDLEGLTRRVNDAEVRASHAFNQNAEQVARDRKRLADAHEEIRARFDAIEKSLAPEPEPEPAREVIKPKSRWRIDIEYRGPKRYEARIWNPADKDKPHRPPFLAATLYNMKSHRQARRWAKRWIRKHERELRRERRARARIETNGTIYIEAGEQA